MNETVTARLEIVRERIAAAGGSGVRVLAVTKGFGPQAIRDAVASGCADVGENYAQEVLGKRDVLAELDGSVRVHFIGRLQSNKVRQLAPIVHRYSSVDRDSLIDEIARRAPGSRILVQVDTTASPGKGGCAPETVPVLVERALAAGLLVDGLMTVGPTEGGPEAARPGFRLVRSIVDELGLEVCSMGMTADLEVAVAEGSTEIRVGTALFGDRPAR